MFIFILCLVILVLLVYIRCFGSKGIVGFPLISLRFLLFLVYVGFPSLPPKAPNKAFNKDPPKDPNTDHNKDSHNGFLYGFGHPGLQNKVKTNKMKT